MSIAVKQSRKIIDDRKKGQHSNEYIDNNKRCDNFDHLNNMVFNKAFDEIMPKIKKRTEFFSNKKEFCWEIKHKSGLNLFKITITIDLIFAVFSHEKGITTYSDSLSAESLSLAIEPHFE